MSDKTTNQEAPPNFRSKLRRGTGSKHGVCAGAALAASVGILIHALLAQAQQPVIRIAPLGSNQFNIVITNGVPTTNYTLFWTPVLANTNYPWIALWGGAVGETNFTVNGLDWPLGFFKVMVGHDLDGDSWPVWQDANDNDPDIGILSVTIDWPPNGGNLN
jgi:hypothetical protein